MPEEYITLVEKEEEREIELYILGKFQASWDIKVDFMKVILPYAIERAIEIGKKEKAKEIRKVLEI